MSDIKNSTDFAPMLIIDGPSGNGIGRQLSKILHTDFAGCEYTLFPDGESEVGIKNPVKNRDVTIVQTTYPEQDKRLLELLLLADNAKTGGARSICAVVPYLAYSRQDKRFSGKNNAISIATILNLFRFVGIKEIITASPHKVQPLSNFSGEVKLLDVITLISNKIKESITDPFILAPDQGATESAKRLSQCLNCGYGSLDKQRDRLTGKVSIRHTPEVKLNNKDVIIVDDMIGGGSTMVHAAKFAQERDAKNIIAVATHLLFRKDTLKKLREVGISEIYGTNTVSNPGRNKDVHVLDIAPLIADVMK